MGVTKSPTKGKYLLAIKGVNFGTFNNLREANQAAEEEWRERAKDPNTWHARMLARDKADRENAARERVARDAQPTRTERVEEEKKEKKERVEARKNALQGKWTVEDEEDARSKMNEYIRRGTYSKKQVLGYVNDPEQRCTKSHTFTKVRPLQLNEWLRGTCATEDNTKNMVGVLIEFLNQGNQ